MRHPNRYAVIRQYGVPRILDTCDNFAHEAITDPNTRVLSGHNDYQEAAEELFNVKERDRFWRRWSMAAAAAVAAFVVAALLT